MIGDALFEQSDNRYCNSRPWQAFEKTLVRPSVADFAPRRFSLALCRVGSEAHQNSFGKSPQGITASKCRN